MTRKQYLGVTFALIGAYLLGGMVRAQTSASKMVEAQSFVLTDEFGKKRGELAIDRTGQPNLKLYDVRGRVIWSAMGAAIMPAR